MRSDFVKFFVILPLIVIILAAGTSYAIFTYLGPGGPEEEPEDESGPSYSLGDFVVNLKGTGGYKYLQTSIVVRVSNEQVVEELDERSPQVRDTIIDILSEQDISEIEDDGNDIVKNQIQTRLKSIINSGEVTDVWFTQFVIQ